MTASESARLRGQYGSSPEAVSVRVDEYLSGHGKGAASGHLCGLISVRLVNTYPCYARSLGFRVRRTKFRFWLSFFLGVCTYSMGITAIVFGIVVCRAIGHTCVRKATKGLTIPVLLMIIVVNTGTQCEAVPVLLWQPVLGPAGGWLYVAV